MRGRLWEIGCLRRVACGDLLVREESSVTKWREEESEGVGGWVGGAGRWREEKRRMTPVKDSSRRSTQD